MRVAFVALSSELKDFPSLPSTDSKPVEETSLVEAWLFPRTGNTTPFSRGKCGESDIPKPWYDGLKVNFGYFC